MSSPTPTDASPSSTTSLTFIPTATPSDKSSTLRIVATIVPIVVIVAITLWGLLIAGGIMHYRRTQDGSSSTDEIDEKQPDVDEPQLWEVSLKSISAADYHDTLHPLAMEIQTEEVSFYPSKGHLSRSQIDVTSKRKMWQSFASASTITCNNTPTTRAQVTVFVAMPSPRAASPEAKHEEYAIGTRNVFFKGDEFKEKEPVEVCEVPIAMELYTHGYIG